VSLQAYSERLDYVLKILPLPLGQAKNGDQQLWKQKFHAANEEAQHALMNNPVFFFERGGNRDFLFFSTCSQCVPNRTWVLSHMVCPNLSSPVYKLKR